MMNPIVDYICRYGTEEHHISQTLFTRATGRMTVLNAAAKQFPSWANDLSIIRVEVSNGHSYSSDEFVAALDRVNAAAAKTNTRRGSR